MSIRGERERGSGSVGAGAGIEQALGRILGIMQEGAQGTSLCAREERIGLFFAFFDPRLQ